MTTDWADFNPHPHMALAQYSQGVPLARKPGGVGSASNTVAASGTTRLINAQIVDQPSFQSILLLTQVATGTVLPFGRVRVTWGDVASGFSAQTDTFGLVAGQNAASVAFIQGPCRGDTITVDLDNIDTVKTLTYSFGVSQVSHVYEVVRVQEVTQVAVEHFTRPSMQPQAGVLASVNTAVAVGPAANFLASAWCGRAFLMVDNSNQPNDVLVQLVDPGQIARGTPLFGTAGLCDFAAIRVAAGQADTIQVSLPNG